jgi:methionyl-tRNA formyltransferase
LDHAEYLRHEYSISELRALWRQDRSEPKTDGASNTLKAWARERHLHIAEFRNLRDRRLLRVIQSWNPDLGVLLGADIVPQPVLDAFPEGVINPHFGVLPAYRGMNVAEWSILNDDPVGISVHFVDAGVDTGDIVAREPINVAAGDSLQSVREKQRRASVGLVTAAVSHIATGTVDRTPQFVSSGRQYFRLHSLLRAHAEAKLRGSTYRWLDREPPLNVA